MSENFSFLLTFLKKIQLSEHNATLTQVRTIYQKIATNQIWQLSKVNFELNSPCQMTLTQFFHNSLTLFLLWRLKKDFEITNNVKILNFEKTGVSHKLAFVSKDSPLQNTLRESKRSKKKIRQGRKTLIPVLAYFWAPLPNIYFCRGDWTLGCFPKQILDFANIS